MVYLQLVEDDLVGVSELTDNACDATKQKVAFRHRKLEAYNFKSAVVLYMHEHAVTS